MAWRFILGFAAWQCYDELGMKYDKYHNHGLGMVIFAGLGTIITDYQPRELEHDIAHQALSLSLVVLPGLLWGLPWFRLLSAEDKAASLWLLISPYLTTLLGYSVLIESFSDQDPLLSWRVAAGLVAAGVLAGHFFSKSSLGIRINQHVSELLSGFDNLWVLRAIAGAMIMFLCEARMIQVHSQAATDPALSKTIPTDTVVPLSMPPLWGMEGPSCVLTWMLGLVLCVTAIDDPQVPAVLVSTSFGIGLPMASLPPFIGEIWTRSFDDYIRLLFIVHVITVSLVLLLTYLLIHPRTRIAQHEESKRSG